MRKISRPRDTCRAGRSVPRMPKDPTLDEMAAAQGTGGPTNLERLMNADFWPEDEDIDEVIATIRRWRDEG